MGYWGFKPMDGDQPLDLFAQLDAPANKLLNKYFGSKRKYYSSEKWEHLGLLQLMMKAGINVNKKILKKALVTLDDVMTDEHFINSWTDPRQLSKEAKKFQSKIKNEIKDF